MQSLSRLLTLILLSASAALSGAQAEEPAAAPTLGDTGVPGADPSIISTEDGFVSVESRRGQALIVRVAPSLDALWSVRGVRIWFDRERLGEVWAPEIVFRDGEYRVYFAAGVGSDHRMYEIASKKPDADYGPAKEIALPEDKWAIDGLPFAYDGADYFVWSGWQGDTDIRQDIFITRLDAAGQPQGERVRISSPDRAWENVAGETPSINEGPQPIRDPDGRLHIVYSANGSWGANYCLADLRLREDGDPMDASAWSKSDGCLFGANEATLAEGGTLAKKAKGVGHHSFILPDGAPEEASAERTAPFLYHGVPADLEPSNFWAARMWYVGTYEWMPDVRYGSGGDGDTGWSLRFSD
ncbi:hypothetical protein VW35_10920 [Devosia soli]|uniref:Hydrolase n=1 Tax=Devosia soli TaxID=361041 RepID=A0A0F5L7G7_9HYPH|nr:glycoside hydrolase family 43 protein [Devosia soli]KKB78175.1 hypothetical protein VW35_10920 [Devosia soli]